MGCLHGLFARGVCKGCLQGLFIWVVGISCLHGLFAWVICIGYLYELFTLNFVCLSFHINYLDLVSKISLRNCFQELVT